jgi:uncharacterized protein with NAD-binding domain and iron-sulfur cluster
MIPLLVCTMSLRKSLLFCGIVSIVLSLHCATAWLPPNVALSQTVYRQPRQDRWTLHLSDDIETNGKDENSPPVSEQKKYVVVGAGWGGWGAAKALCQSKAEVILLDVLPDPTGRTKPFLSLNNKPVEAGIRGFWKDYPNINRLCEELQLRNVFTDFTGSSFYSPQGRETSAPVFANATFPPNLPFLSGQPLPSPIPSPLGQILATLTLFERLPLSDRVSMIGLLVATVDCLGNANYDERVIEAYDRMTAHELFIRFGLSNRLVQDFLRPTLLVGLFKPPEELSALVVMELLYYYALAHTDSFDVRWIRNGTVASSLIAPLATRLEQDYNFTMAAGCRVQRISTALANNQGRPVERVSSISYLDPSGQTRVIQDIDGVVLAVTSQGMKSIVPQSPDLAKYPVFTQAASCSGIDVISLRLWLDRVVPTRTPANVWANFPALRGAGGTFFMLDQLQGSEGLEALWGSNDTEHSKGSVVACDFYNAGALLTVPDAELIRIVTEELLPAAVPDFASAQVVDSWVGRFPGAVSWFAPGTYGKRPPIEGAMEIVNLKCAGDWVRLGDREHGAKGLCQERAYVTGLEAANALLRLDRAAQLHGVLPVREDEVAFRIAVAANRQIMKFLPRIWVR